MIIMGRRGSLLPRAKRSFVCILHSTIHRGLSTFNMQLQQPWSCRSDLFGRWLAVGAAERAGAVCTSSHSSRNTNSISAAFVRHLLHLPPRPDLQYHSSKKRSGSFSLTFTTESDTAFSCPLLLVIC